MRAFFFIFLLIFLANFCSAEEAQPLPPDQAFNLSIKLSEKNNLLLQWKIAPGYYLYKDQIKITPAENNFVSIRPIVLPNAIQKKDNIRGNYEIYKNKLEIKIPFEEADNKILYLNIRYQGCSAKGFCYAPITKWLEVDLSVYQPPFDLTSFISLPSAHPLLTSEPDSIQSIFNGKSYFFILISFLGIGILLSFTPCVLPMIPILSGIIMGHRKKKLTTLKSFLLSLSYVMGAAITYSIAGMMIALLGSHLQAELQRPWVIILFASLFVLLALSLFGFYRIQVPLAWQQKLTHWSNRQKGGTYLGVFLMGGLSSLIATPCISPPLVGVLAYIGQSGNIWLGASALLALGIGMGIPLLLIGASAGKLLPRAGAWMETIEEIMGFIMMAFALWMLSRILPGPVILFLWAILILYAAIFLRVFSRTKYDWRLLRSAIRCILVIYGIILLVGAGLGNSNPLYPWENLNSAPKAISSQSQFITIKNEEQLNEQLLSAKQKNKPVLIDFYADWCVTCVRMERFVFGNAEVQVALKDFVLLRVDVTQNTQLDQILLKRFNVIAPPTFLFFNTQGQLQKQMVGEIATKDFLSYIKKMNELE